VTTESSKNQNFIRKHPSEGMDALEKESKLPLKGWDNEVARAKEYGLEAAKSIVDRKISTFSRGELPHFAGINTFMKAPYIENVNEVEIMMLRSLVFLMILELLIDQGQDSDRKE